MFGEALLGLLTLDVVDDGPMTICGTVVTGTIDVNVAGICVKGKFDVAGIVAVGSVGAFWDGPGSVLSVIGGTPVTEAHILSNASMMPCASETTLIEGSFATMQLTQACMLVEMGMVQRQLGVVQAVIVDSTDAQTEAHAAGSNCLDRIMSNERRAVSTRW